jgi:hypothetical protein
MYLGEVKLNFKKHDLESLKNKDQLYTTNLISTLTKFQKKLEPYIQDKPPKWLRIKNWLAERLHMSPKKPAL